MSAFDALQPHAPATFDRAADVIRAGRPRPDRRPLVLVAAFVLAVGACVTPVESDDLVGFAVEWTAYGAVGPGHHTMKALDAVVPASARFAVETQRAERPDVPTDHAWPDSGTWTRVRYTTGTTQRTDADAWADRMRSLVGAYNVRFEPVIQRERRPLAATALGRIGQAVSPSDPDLTDDDLQALLDAVDHGALPDRFRPRVSRLPDGRRVIGDTFSAVVLDDEVRVWIRPDAVPSQRVTYEGITDARLLFRGDGAWRPWSEIKRVR